jgi:HSP20 family molecular chaperone IbpA
MWRDLKMSNVTVWSSPLADFDSLVRWAFGPTATRPYAGTPGFVPAAEVTRDGDDAVVRFELPGVDVEKDVTVEVDGGELVVRGERRDERAPEQGGRGPREIRYGAFRRSFSLPQHVTADAVAASYDAGVLSVRITGAYAGTGARKVAITSATAPQLDTSSN